jgi:CheY-like chemotaxis protein
VKRETPHAATILIADDNPTNLQVFHYTLRNEGYRVLVAEDGRSACERVEIALPDLVLLDVMMPGIDGFDTCRRLKENPKTRDIPVIFLSAIGERDFHQRATAAGGIDYLCKPIKPADLIAAVERHLPKPRAVGQSAPTAELWLNWIDVLAHDVRGQVAIADGFLGLLKEVISPPLAAGDEIDEYLATVNGAHATIIRTIAAAVTVRALENYKLALSSFDLVEVLARCSEYLEQESAFEWVDLSAGLDGQIHSDEILFESWVQTVMSTLLSLRGTHSPAPITLSLRQAPSGLVLGMRVAGVELSQREAKHFFNLEITEKQHRIPRVGVTIIGAAHILKLLQIGGEVSAGDAGVHVTFHIPRRIEKG